MKTETQKYELRPCNGVTSLGLPRGHLYRVMDNQKKILVDIGTKENIFKKYGEENCFVSGVDTLCNICFEYNMRNLGDKPKEIDLKVIEG